MAYCTKCGSTLETNAKFCTKCGAAVDAADVQRSAKLIKCPECGEPIPSFSAACPLCGYELRGSKATSSVVELSQKLDEIERNRPRQDKKKRLFKNPNQEAVTPTDERKVTLIHSFPIPNTKEDLVEFLILAASNVDPRDFAETHQSTASQKALTDAWYSKMNQAYAKASIALGDDPAFIQAKKKYEDVEAQVAKNRRKTDLRLAAVLLICSFLSIFLICGIGNLYRCSLSPEQQLQYDIDHEESSCKSDENSIKSDIEDGDFDDARNKTYALEFDAELSEERYEYWEKRKEELLDTIDKAEARER